MPLIYVFWPSYPRNQNGIVHYLSEVMAERSARANLLMEEQTDLYYKVYLINDDRID